MILGERMEKDNFKKQINDNDTVFWTNHEKNMELSIERSTICWNTPNENEPIYCGIGGSTFVRIEGSTFVLIGGKREKWKRNE